MAQEFATGAKNTMLDAITVNLISLHTGDPGAAGTNNEVSGGGYARVAGTFNAAASGQRLLNAAVDFVGPPSSSVTWIGVWNSAGPVFMGRTPLTGDTAFNSLGEFTIAATTTLLDISDPA
jgi:hypothetical protein